MSSRNQRLYADYRQAAALLRDDLVWSGDFDSIRYDLMCLIEREAEEKKYTPEMTALVHKLIAEENDLSI
jgi:hypothetical protein